MGAAEMPYVKIGRSDWPLKRASDLQVACPYEILIWGVRFTTPLAAKRLEHEVHVTARNLGLHHRLEWFDASPMDALAIIDRVADNIGARAYDLASYEKARAIGENDYPPTALGKAITDRDLMLLKRRLAISRDVLTK